MSYTAFVPARSGSKRLPNKNIMNLAGKPLLVWTLEACVESSKVDEVILSTDSMEYWELAKQHITSDKLTLDFRSPDEAADTVKIFDYLKGERQKIFENRSGSFILALPTVPLRNSTHINEAIQLFEEKEKPVFSATTYGFPVSFSFKTLDDGEWESVFPDNPMMTGNTRSQNQQETYHPNGAIYVRSIDDLGKADLLTLYTGAVPYLMDRMQSIDIDREIDFKFAEALL